MSACMRYVEPFTSSLGRRWSVDASISGQLGSGCYGNVVRVERLNSGTQRAAKSIPKKKQERSAINFEVTCLSIFDHPNIVKAYEVFECDEYVHIIMEHAAGGSLHNYIHSYGFLVEADAQWVMKQVLRAVRCMHAMGVCHRDLMARNMLLQQSGPLKGNTIKVADFGIASLHSPDQKAQRNELWQCGVLLDHMLQGPRDEGSGDESKSASIYAREHVFTCRVGDVKLAEVGWSRVSQQAKDFACLLFKKRDQDSTLAHTLLEHPWILCAWNPALVVAAEDLTHLLEKMRAWSNYDVFKRAALRKFAHFEESDQFLGYLRLFHALDINGDGFVTPTEIFSAFSAAGISAGEDLPRLMQCCDTSSIGALDRTTFVAIVMDFHSCATAETCSLLFDFFDTSGQGEITVTDMLRVIPERPSATQVDMIIRKRGNPGNGTVDFDGFVKMLWEQASNFPAGCMTSIRFASLLLTRHAVRNAPKAMRQAKKHKCKNPSLKSHVLATKILNFTPLLQPSDPEDDPAVPPFPEAASLLSNARLKAGASQQNPQSKLEILKCNPSSKVLLLQQQSPRTKLSQSSPTWQPHDPEDDPVRPALPRVAPPPAKAKAKTKAKAAGQSQQNRQSRQSAVAQVQQRRTSALIGGSQPVAPLKQTQVAQAPQRGASASSEVARSMSPREIRPIASQPQKQKDAWGSFDSQSSLKSTKAPSSSASTAGVCQPGQMASSLSVASDAWEIRKSSSLSGLFDAWGARLSTDRSEQQWRSLARAMKQHAVYPPKAHEESLEEGGSSVGSSYESDTEYSESDEDEDYYSDDDPSTDAWKCTMCESRNDRGRFVCGTCRKGVNPLFA